MPMRPKTIKELFALLKRKYGRHDDKIAPRSPPLPPPSRSGLSPLQCLLLVMLAAKVMAAAIGDQPAPHRHHNRPATVALDAQVDRMDHSDDRACRVMPDGVLRQVGVLLLEDPDQRDYVATELRFKGWCFPDGL
jgi:hypothetical protein